MRITWPTFSALRSNGMVAITKEYWNGRISRAADSRPERVRSRPATAHDRGSGVPAKKDDIGTQLREAFAREAESVVRCLFYARRADVEGRADIASVLRSIADGEISQAFGHLEFLEETGDPLAGGGDAAGDLAAVIDAEGPRGRALLGARRGGARRRARRRRQLVRHPGRRRVRAPRRAAARRRGGPLMGERLPLSEVRAGPAYEADARRRPCPARHRAALQGSTRRRPGARLRDARDGAHGARGAAARGARGDRDRVAAETAAFAELLGGDERAGRDAVRGRRRPGRARRATRRARRRRGRGVPRGRRDGGSTGSPTPATAGLEPFTCCSGSTANSAARCRAAAASRWASSTRPAGRGHPRAPTRRGRSAPTCRGDGGARCASSAPCPGRGPLLRRTRSAMVLASCGDTTSQPAWVAAHPDTARAGASRPPRPAFVPSPSNTRTTLPPPSAIWAAPTCRCSAGAHAALSGWP